VSQLPTSSTALEIPSASGAQAHPDGTGRTRSRWTYPVDAGTRDLRIDFLRGLAMMFVVVDHIDLFSAHHLISHERIGVVSGAELFVVLSGIVLGIAHRRRVIVEGWRPSASRMWARARLLYLVSLAVLVTSYVLSHLPGLNGQALTTWTDEATGTVHDLYATTPLLAEYPVPPPAVFDILLLNVGPYQFNVMGLYVVLLAIAPFAVRLLLAERWLVLMLASLALYGANLVLQLRVPASAFENPFPLLSWQLLFFAGLTVGFSWEAVKQWFDRPLGRTLVVLSWVAVAGLLFFTWNNPAKENDPGALRLDLIPEGIFWRIYEDWFRRDFLGILRVVNVAAVLVAAYTVLTRIWTPVYRLLGWLLVPLGSATLYVFILHLPFVLIVYSLPFLDDASVWMNTLTHMVILVILWVMVRTQFLFRWIPR
jgi:hypothetical protein